ncbi:MAG: prepilin-type N-terminal cleavage/methylation domain-containing protein [Lentisphaeria bacterium]
MKNRNYFTLVEIMIVVAIIGLLAAIAIPSFINARENAQTNACINNLRQIDGAKQQCALETGASSPDANALNEYIDGEISLLACPADPDDGFDTSYTINGIDDKPICQINADSTDDLGHIPSSWE